ncbi:DNA mismatch repair endonuclease MutL [Moorena bouillonii]|uniref:DNA mismatch repair protein MutL n=1 Tax=Moorena bouillonii PNG TaxID=568701 RepID=A0A1U7N5K5_9CYAN|nr:DNA mismatch repair endonuclease MutL [Moorena bouillonii]OLT61240.1 DNA mismatch repair protein MutL [Moorena bouillonii PNG]
MIIQTLPKNVVHLIAAGEVIDSIAAVVRELIENSLDAGATRITVSLWTEQWRVRVADNGTGMEVKNLQKAAFAHSTSKISSSDDLWKITSLGFRGEALHSLAAVAELEILSRCPGNSQGWRVIYNSQGELRQIESAAIAPGTIVIVSNLFGKLPVRRQGLPAMAQQLRAVQTIIHQHALCHPRVSWQVEQNGRPWFNLCPGHTAQQILPQIIKQLKESDLQPLTVEVPIPDSGTEQEQDKTTKGNVGNGLMELVLGLPDRCHRRRADWVKVATNGRIVRSHELEQTMITALARTLPRDRYPICFLHLRICPSQIDWNRHPAKTEIYLHSVSYWQEQVAEAIEHALRITPATLPEAIHSNRVKQLLKTSEARGGYTTSRSIQGIAATQEITDKTDSKIDSKTDNKTDDIGLIQLRAVAQLHNMYIVAEHPTGIWLIEQHIAHERVLYEELCDRWQLVPLEPPIILQQLSPSQVEQLQRIGLEVDPFGEELWAVRNAPELLRERDDCAKALLELSLGGDLQTAQVATACRSAIRNGIPLSLSQMQQLLDQWKKTRNPRTCPHGRPIYLSLKESALSRFFRRHWVIGKSHGI